MAAQDGVDGLRHVAMDDDVVALHDLDQHVEGRRGLALQHRLLGPAAPGLLVAQGDRLDPAHQVGERGVQHEVVERVAVRGAHKLDAALRDGPCRLGLQLGADLVDDDHLGHVVLDRLDHHVVLLRRRADLHAARVADPGVRDVAVAGDLVRGVHHHDALAEIVGEHPGHLAQHGGLAHSGPAEEQDAAAALDHVADDVDGPEDRATDAAGQAHHLAGAVADGADAMEGPLDPGAVVVAEDADVVHDVPDVGLGDLAVEKHLLAVGEARLRATPQVHDHLEQVAAIGERAEAGHDLRGERRHQVVQVVGRLSTRHACHAASSRSKRASERPAPSPAHGSAREPPGPAS